MLPSGRQLQQLESLTLGCGFSTPNTWHVPAVDLHRITTSCPRLHSLSIPGLLEPGSDLTPLLQLTSCKKLRVGGPAFDNGRAAPVLTQLTQLTSLEWECSWEYPRVNDLEQLMLLPQLQRLGLTGGITDGAWIPLEKAIGRSVANLQLTASEQVSELCCGHVCIRQTCAQRCLPGCSLRLRAKSVVN